MISSLKKARKWTGEGGVRFVVLLSIIGLKTCFPIKCLLVNTLLQVHKCFYEGEQVSAVPEGTPFSQLRQDCHPLLIWDVSPRPQPSLWSLVQFSCLGADWSSLRWLILFNFLFPSAKSGMHTCVRVVSPCKDTFQSLGVRAEFENKVAFCPVVLISFTVFNGTCWLRR